MVLREIGNEEQGYAGRGETEKQRGRVDGSCSPAPSLSRCSSLCCALQLDPRRTTKKRVEERAH